MLINLKINIIFRAHIAQRLVHLIRNEKVHGSNPVMVLIFMKIIIYFVNNSNNSILDIKKKISVKLSLHFSAIELREIDQIPKNASGKTIYKELS